jgi:hypothetical protein
MSPSARVRQSGLGALLVANGEALGFGNPQKFVKGLVNRKVTKVRDGIQSRDGKLDFSVLGLSEIEIPRSAMALPVAGDVFLDEFNFNHRVRYVVTTDISWVLYCTPSQKTA